MNFKELITRSKAGDQAATEAILNMYRPLLVKESLIDGLFDEDLFQELCITLLHCLVKFQL